MTTLEKLRLIDQMERENNARWEAMKSSAKQTA